MALGKRPSRPQKSSASKSRRAPETEADEELLTWSEKNPGQLQGIVALGSVFVAACLLIFSAPHTYASKTINYNTGQMVEGSLSEGLLPEYKADLEARLGVDFGGILTPASEEKTEPMQRVAIACLPKGKFKSFVLPGGRGTQVLEAYGQATDYLVCAMANERARLCQSHERERLVEQLMQYRERRQNVLALHRYEDRTKEKIKKSAVAQYQKAQYEEHASLQNGHTAAPVAAGRIGMNFDPRITTGITELVKNGLLSASDFGWLGLYLPEEYVASLSADTYVRSCG